LIVDDEPSNVLSLEKIFAREAMRTFTADGARGALELLRKHRIQVVLTDLMMPGTSGLELLRAVKEVSPDTEVVVMTAYATVETAVQAMREGAYDFVEKPLRRVQIVKSVRKAAERNALLTENRSLKIELKLLTRREIVGQSGILRRVLELATQAAPSMATVLVLGESGTGKELLARYLHERSARAKGPFVGVNCAALPESILEAELFGHEKGAFTGAVARREGRFAKASGGTLFLDEIGELSPAIQVKLLRVLQEGEYEPVGGDTRRTAICAPRSSAGVFARIYSIASTSSRSPRRRSAPAAKTCRFSATTSSGCIARRTRARASGSPPRSPSAFSTTLGPETCASSRT